MFCVALGRQMAAVDRSQPMSFGIDPSLRSVSSVAVFSNHRWLALAETRSSGVKSKSAPAPVSINPGLLKLDCPCSFEERSELRMPLRPLTDTARPPPANGMVCLIQYDVSAPAKTGFSNTAS